MNSPLRPFRFLSLPVLSWAFYDFANTIFSFAVITRYFNEWVIDEKGYPDWYIGAMMFAVGTALFFIMPIVGAVTDQVRTRHPFLVIFTLACIVATGTLGFVSSLPAILGIAGVAIFFYYLSLAMYDPMLSAVAPPDKQGTVSGFGVGLGYIGVIVGSLTLSSLVPAGEYQGAFLPTAMLYLVFSLPIFAFVRDRTQQGAHANQAIVKRGIAKAAVRQVFTTLGHINSEYREVGRFLVARFLYVDAIATVLAYMTVYMNRVGDFSESQKTLALILAMVGAAGGAFVCGRLVNVVGPKRVLSSVLIIFAIVLAGAGITGSASAVWIIGPVAGICLGGVWTSDRVLMLRLTPEAVRGEFFGIYNLVGKLSSGLGPLVLWGGTIWLLSNQGSFTVLDASRAALVVLAAAIIAGLMVLKPLQKRQ